MQMLSLWIVGISCVHASRLRTSSYHRRTTNATNETLLADSIVEDGLDLPSITEDVDNATDTNLTNAEFEVNGTNSTDSASIISHSPSLSPSITMTPTQPISANSSSYSPSIAPSTTLSPTSLDLPTSSPHQTTPAPTYGQLPIQAINILVLTDVHSWVQGHSRHEPELNADYGDVLSFYRRLRSQTDSTKLSDGSIPDLYFVMNGDFVHGSILGQDPPISLSGILERMPYDVVTVGNHDIKNEETVKELMKAGGLVDIWGERLVTSNVRVNNSSSEDETIDDLIPLGNNYRFLRGNQGTILTLGFLYNLSDDETAITVETVQDVIQQSWFTSLFASPRPTDFDAILVLAHMKVDDELITLLLDTLRNLVGKSMVIQFVTGHTHTRSYVELDSYSTSFEAGRYLDTIGFMSFNSKQGDFEHVFVNANKASIAQSLGMKEDEYPTQDGTDLSEYIERTFEHAGANAILGCSPIRYRKDGYLNETDSLLRLYLEEVMPSSFLEKYSSGSHYTSHENVLIQRLDWFVKYDLFAGTVTFNDLVGVVPEDFTIISMSNSIRGRDIMNIRDAWSNNETFLDNTTTVVGVSISNANEIDSSAKYDLYTLSEFLPSLNKIIINDLKVESFSSPHPVYNGEKTMRTMWADYIRMTWPYDGNKCECIQTSTCGNLTQSDMGDSGGWPWEKPTSSSTSHGPTQVSLPSSPNPPVPETSESRHQSSGSHTSPKSSGDAKSHSSSGAFVFIAVALAAIFYTLRSRRQGYTAARDALRNNDLELRVTRPPGHGSVVPPAGYGNMNPQPGGYSSPQFSRGNYV